MNKSFFLHNETYAKLMKKDDLIIERPADRDVSTMEPFATLGGIQFVASEWAPKSIRVQFRKPRSKKARIRKKWAKDSRNWKMVNVMWIVDTSKLVRFVPPASSLSDLPYYQQPQDWASQIIGLSRGIYPITRWDL